jgi:hypothetical protein
MRPCSLHVCVKTFESNDECNKLINLSLYVLGIVPWYYTHLSIICVNLWFWHTYEMYSVFFGKTGVTYSTRNSTSHPSSPSHKPGSRIFSTLFLSMLAPPFLDHAITLCCRPNDWFPCMSSQVADWIHQVLHDLCKTSKHYPFRRIVGPLSAQIQRLLQHSVTKRDQKERTYVKIRHYPYCIDLLPHYFGTINHFSKKKSNQQLYVISSTSLL